MRRLATFLVFLLLILTFNAYACILPLQTTTQMDCDSGTDSQARQTCDAFLEIGPQSQVSSHHVVSTFTLECPVPIHVPETFVSGVELTPPPRGSDTPIHCSIPTTVLRI
jgi:hypothetical protein